MTNNYSLEPGTVYHDLDEAMHAASCMSSQHQDGATVYGTTSGPDLAEPDGEAYRIAVKCVRRDGSTWAVPPAPYRPIYTITSHLR